MHKSHTHNTHRMWIDVHLIVVESERGQIRAVEDHEHAEEEKVAMIVEADAVVEPRTVMVHLEHTPIANAAMVGARRLGRHALATHGHDVVDVGGGRIARIGDKSHCVVKERVKGEPVADEEVSGEVKGGRVRQDHGQDHIVKDEEHVQRQGPHENHQKLSSKET